MRLNFKQLIDTSGLTQTQIAKELNVSYPTINNLYKGTAKSIYFDKLEELCNLLHCTPNDVLIMDSDKNVVDSKSNVIDSYSFNDIKYNIPQKSANDLKNFEDLMLRTTAYHDAFNNMHTTLKYRKIKDEEGKTMIVPYFSIDEDS